MNAKPWFVDTNILVYAYDADAGTKHDIANTILIDLWKSDGAGRISVQVLQEFYVTMTRKLAAPLTDAQAREVISMYEAWQVYSPNVDDLHRTSEIAEHQNLSFWDAMIIIAASMSGARTVISEDLHDGLKIAGLAVVNPFTSHVLE